MRTTDEIYRALAARVADSSGAVVADGGDLSLRLRAVAAEIFSLEAQTEFLTRQCFPQTASGTYLDRHAAVRGLARGSAQKASGSLRFYVDADAESDIAVPVGTVCMTAVGTAFQTTEAGTIETGTRSCTVAAEAVEPGAHGNAAEESVVYIIHTPSSVLGVVNDAAFSGGTDGEDDEALRARVLHSYRALPNGANVAYYESRVLDFPFAAAVSVLPRERGAGTVDVIFSTHSGVPTAAEISAVQDLLDSEREISVDVLVSAPTEQEVDIDCEIETEDDADFDAVQSAADAALRAYFNGSLLGRAVYRAKLSAILMAVEGVRNCTLNEPAADLSATADVLPTLGTLTIGEAV
jgi:uncharacterized phage protein gp47/JayE